MSASELTQTTNTFQGLLLCYKIAVQIERLQIFHLHQNIATLQLSVSISNELNDITPQFREFR